MIDYHNHTHLCRHAEGEVFEYIEQAIQSGIKEIAFTDHIPLPADFDRDHRMSFQEMEVYEQWIQKAKEQYPEIIIRFGIEADYYEGFETFLSNFLSKYEFDLVIMSVHFIRHWSQGNWVFEYNFPEKNQDEIYRDYINTVKKGVSTGLFDVLGHADMIKMPGDSLIKLIPNDVEELLSTLKKHRMAIEINTSGYRKKAQESYPGLDWLPAIMKHCVPICTGSDAHKPEQVGLRFEEIYHSFIDLHPLKFVRFEKRQQTLIDLNEILKKKRNP